jgi:hypothetical protein
MTGGMANKAGFIGAAVIALVVWELSPQAVTKALQMSKVSKPAGPVETLCIFISNNFFGRALCQAGFGAIRRYSLPDRAGCRCRGRSLVRLNLFQPDNLREVKKFPGCIFFMAEDIIVLKSLGKIPKTFHPTHDCPLYVRKIGTASC